MLIQAAAMIQRCLAALFVTSAGLAFIPLRAAAAAPAGLKPGAEFTLSFPDFPPTYYDREQKSAVGAQLTILLPTNYDPAKKHPLFIFLSGGNGGAGRSPAVARAITGGKDFVCASLPLFRAPESQPSRPGALVIMGPADGRYMWPLFKKMIERIDDTVPNIDSAHRVLGGFSNGAHATVALIDASEGEVSRRFCGFFCGEGGGKLQHYEYLHGRAFMMLSSNARSEPRAREICAAARAAGADTTFVLHDVGQHAFPVAAYPAVRDWLQGLLAR